MCVDRSVCGRSTAVRVIVIVIASETAITCEGLFLDAPVNSSFFKRFQSRGLGVGRPGFSAAFGKRPSSATASTNEKEFNFPARDSIANCRDLLTGTEFAKPR